MAILKVKRGTKAQIDAAAVANQLLQGEPYLITDEGRLAVGLTSGTYAAFAKTSEVQALDADLTAISGLTGTGFLKRTGVDTWALDTNSYLEVANESKDFGNVAVVDADTGHTWTSTGTVSSDTLADTLTLVPGSGINLHASAGTDAVRITHADTSSVSNLTSDNSGGTYIQDLNLSFDGFGHVTGASVVTGTVGDATLTAAVSSAGSTNTAVALNFSGTFSANSTTNRTINAVVGPALSNLATTMTGATTGFLKKTAQDTYTLDTSTYLTGNQNISVTGDASGSGTTAISLTLASVGTAGTYTKVTTDAKGRVTSGTTLLAADIPTLTAAKISDFDTQVRTSRLNQMATPNADVAFGGYKITGLADPVSPQDAATKNYVDLAIQGLDPKAGVKAATTANIALSGEQTIDGIQVFHGDRVLVKDQATSAQNGIYEVVSGAAWTRTSDANTWNELIGAYVFVEMGVVNGDNGYLFTVDAGGTLGVTDITISQFSGAGQITAGAGLVKTGNQIDVVGTTNRILVNADSIDIASTYVGQVSITTLGTVTTGTWNGTTIAPTSGGTGLTSYATGDIVYASAANTLSKLTKPASATSFLQMTSAGVPSWTDVVDGGTF